MTKNFTEQVIKMIDSRSLPNKSPERIYIDKVTFKGLCEELEPFYKKRYGGFISKDLPYMNIIFRGVAVCLSHTPTQRVK